MHIRDIFARDRITFSFEFFPPADDAGWEKLFGQISQFEALEPSFVSVTYGAGGSTRDRTHNLVTRLQRETRLDPIPHLTCVCHTPNEIEAILERYVEAGVDNLMALRGDPPRDLPNYDRSRDHFQHAADLVRLIKRFGERQTRAAGGSVAKTFRGFGVGVAGFPEGHPDTPNQLLQMDHLKAKVDAGADYVCTQLFFDNHEFYDWSERCKLAGIKVPLVAGIMPITSIAGMRRMAELAGGTKFPAALLKTIYRCQDDAAAVARVGAHWATEQCRDLIDHGVQGIHFYTLNRSDATKRIYETLGAKNSAGLR
jgi:methylenetetrahydrofolate reductase (NADPH)